MCRGAGYPGEDEGPAAGPRVHGAGAGRQGLRLLPPRQQEPQGLPRHHLWPSGCQSCQGEKKIQLKLFLSRDL